MGTHFVRRLWAAEAQQAVAATKCTSDVASRAGVMLQDADCDRVLARTDPKPKLGGSSLLETTTKHSGVRKRGDWSHRQMGFEIANVKRTNIAQVLASPVTHTRCQASDAGLRKWILGGRMRMLVMVSAIIKQAHSGKWEKTAGGGDAPSCAQVRTSEAL